MTDVSDEPGRDEAGRDKGLDDAWARIVADYDRVGDDEGSTPRWPVQEDISPDAGTGGDSGDGAPFVLSLGDPPTAPRQPASWDDDGSTRGEWVPPQPPPLPRPTGAAGVAWVGLGGGPLLLLAATIAGWRLPALLTAGCIICFVGGLVFLIVQMEDGAHRDGWDDGAQI